MDLVSFDVNWLAVVAGPVVMMVLGFIWYHEAVLGKTWMKSIGFKKSDLNPDPMVYLFTFLWGLVSAFVLANLIRVFGVTEAVDGAMVGVMASLLVVAALFSTLSFEKRSMSVWVIDALYHVFSLAIIGAILAVWV